MNTPNPSKNGNRFVKILPWLITTAIITLFFFSADNLYEVTSKIFFKIADTEKSYTPSEDSESFNYSFIIKDLENNKIHFTQFKGKVVFINLWATWCGPCRAEMPTIEELYRKVKHNDIQFIMLSLDEDSDSDKVRRFIEQNNYSFPVYMPSGNLPPQLQVPSIPTTFIVNKQGNIVRRKVGKTNFNTEHYVKILEELAQQ